MTVDLATSATLRDTQTARLRLADFVSWAWDAALSGLVVVAIMVAVESKADATAAGRQWRTWNSFNFEPVAEFQNMHRAIGEIVSISGFSPNELMTSAILCRQYVDGTYVNMPAAEFSRRSQCHRINNRSRGQTESKIFDALDECRANASKHRESWRSPGIFPNYPDAQCNNLVLAVHSDFRLRGHYIDISTLDDTSVPSLLLTYPRQDDCKPSNYSGSERSSDCSKYVGVASQIDADRLDRADIERLTAYLYYGAIAATILFFITWLAR